jgi:plasmid stabilization system protein ParE
MKIVWSSAALEEIGRLHDFLSAVNPSAAAKAVQSLAAAPEKLIEHPRLGEKLDQFSPHEVRRIFVGPVRIAL